MKLVLKKEDALAAISRVLPYVASGKSDKPVLRCLMLSATKGDTDSVSVRGGDGGQRNCCVEIPSSRVMAGGSVLVDARKLFELFTAAAESELRVFVDDKGRCHISTDRAKWTLPTEDASIYPVLDKLNVPGIKINATALASAFHQVSYAMDDTSSRYALGGIQLKTSSKSKDTLDVVATDGRRMSMCSVGVSDATKKISCIVPSFAIKSLESILGACADVADVMVHVTESRIQFVLPLVTATFALVEGRFPSHEMIFEKIGPKAIEANVAMMARTIRQAAIATDQESRGIELLATEGTLKAFGRAKNIGQSEIELPVAMLDVKKLRTCLDSRYMLDALGRWEDAAMVTVYVEDDNNNIQVVMACNGTQVAIMPLATEK